MTMLSAKKSNCKSLTVVNLRVTENLIVIKIGVGASDSDMISDMLRPYSYPQSD